MVFIAVNSGNPKSAVEGYAKSTKFEWPILVDESGETEKSLNIQISLQNIYQWRLVTPDGRLTITGPDPRKVREDVNRELPGAKMFFDGVAVPAKLKPLAQEIEMGNYDPAVGEIALAAQKGGKDIQEGARAMFDKLKPMAEGGLERAKAFEGEGKKYAATLEYARVAAWFRKTDYEKTATAALAELKKDKTVQEELSAKQLLDQAKGLLATGKKADKPSALGILQALQKKYPDSEARKEADRLIASLK